MESQNIDRRDSKKSNKNGGSKSQARGGGSGNGAGGGGKSSTGGEKQRSHSQKSGKRYQEIYKPPSTQNAIEKGLRSSKNRNSNSSSEQQSQSSPKGNNNYDEGIQSGSHHVSLKKSNSSNNQSPPNNGVGGKGNMSPQMNGHEMNNDPSNNSYSLFGNGNPTMANNGNSSVPSSPLISSRMQNSFNFGLAKRMYNVNAKEFQFLPIHQQQQQQQQQLSNFLSQFDPSIFYNNSPILASSGCYPLKQSKSSGNMNLLLQQAQQQQQVQAAAIQQLQIAMGLNASLQSGNFPGSNANNNGNSQFNRLSQSKSSGNVPAGGSRPRVRFDDEEVDFDDVDDNVLGGQLGNYLASLKMNGDLSGMPPASNFPIGFPFQQQQQQSKQAKAVPLSPQPVLKSSLQKSRTGFYLNLYENQQQSNHQQTQQTQLGSPTKPVYGYNAGIYSGNSGGGPNYPTKLTGNMGSNISQHQSFTGSSSGIVKRSRSFGPGNHHLPRVSATALLSASTTHCGSTTTCHSVYSDFCITKWPRIIQELVTAAVTGVERIPARNWIEMVNGIFEAMLCDYRPKKKDKNMKMTTVGGDSNSVGITTGGNATSGICTSSGTNNDKFSTELSLAAGGSSSEESAGKNQNADTAAKNNDHTQNLDDNEDDEEEDDDNDTDLTSAAVHIFLYFIQREKDRTVMESLLNTCFASFQRLSSASINTNSSSAAGKSVRTQKVVDQIGKPSISRQWCNFLRFLSTLYSQVKLIRRQKQSQQQPGHSMDEMSFSLLALLCDSCLATLRSPQSYTAEMMGCLFTVLTSIGRDMEGTFPLKMKQLLAAVRDALLGIGPYHQQQQQHHNQYNPNSSPATSKSSISSLSPIVQKTLMQLIELHAANWQLPASAVRYYYSSVSNSKSTSSSTTNTSAHDSGLSSLGNNQNQFQKSSNNKNNGSGNGGVGATTTDNYSLSTPNMAVRPTSSSSACNSSNDNDESKDNINASTTQRSAEPSAHNSIATEAEQDGKLGDTGAHIREDVETKYEAAVEIAPRPEP